MSSRSNGVINVWSRDQDILDLTVPLFLDFLELEAPRDGRLSKTVSISRNRVDANVIVAATSSNMSKNFISRGMRLNPIDVVLHGRRRIRNGLGL